MKDLIEDFVSDSVEKKQHSYFCKIDGQMFNSETLIISHFRNAHKSKIISILKSMSEDLEQDYLGNFFTKILYSDLIALKGPAQAHHSSTSDFPSVLAPTIAKEQLPPEKQPNFETRESKSQISRMRELENFVSERKKERRILKPIFTNDELIELEGFIFGTPIPSTTNSHSSSDPKKKGNAAGSGIPIPTEQPIPATATSSGAEKNSSSPAPTAKPPIETPPNKPTTASTKNNTASTNKGGLHTPPKEVSSSTPVATQKKGDTATSKPTATSTNPKTASVGNGEGKANKQTQQQPPVRPNNASENGLSSESGPSSSSRLNQGSVVNNGQKSGPSHGNSAETKNSQEKPQQAPSPSPGPAVVPQGQVAAPLIKVDKKLKKQIEDDILNDISEDVVIGLVTKLANRTMQEIKKTLQKEKEEEERMRKEFEEMKEKEGKRKEKERRMMERKERREVRKQESEKFLDEIVDELVSGETELIIREVVGDYLPYPASTHSNAPLVGMHTGGVALNRAAPPFSSFVPHSPNFAHANGPQNFPVHAFVSNPRVSGGQTGASSAASFPQPFVVAPQFAQSPFFPQQQGFQQGANPADRQMGPHHGDSMMYFGQGASGFAKVGPSMSHNSGFSSPFAVSSGATSVPAMGASSSGRGATSSVVVENPTLDLSNLVLDEKEIFDDLNDDSREIFDNHPSFGSSTWTFNSGPKGLFGGIFPSKSESVTLGTTSSSQTQIVDRGPSLKRTGVSIGSKSGLGNNHHGANATEGSEMEPNMGSTNINKPEEQNTLVPEELGLDSAKSVTISNMPSDAKKSHLNSFFKGLIIAVEKENFATKIKFWGNGCAFVEFETADDCARALERSGQMINDRVVKVTRPSGILMTSETGQKFALHTKARNVVAPVGYLQLQHLGSASDPSKPLNPTALQSSASGSSSLASSSVSSEKPPTANIMNPVAPEFRPAAKTPNHPLESSLERDNSGTTGGHVEQNGSGFVPLNALYPRNPQTEQEIYHDPNFPMIDYHQQHEMQFHRGFQHNYWAPHTGEQTFTTSFASQESRPSFSLDPSMFPPLSSDSKGN